MQRDNLDGIKAFGEKPDEVNIEGLIPIPNGKCEDGERVDMGLKYPPKLTVSVVNTS
jgi:hypothetical protein